MYKPHLAHLAVMLLGLGKVPEIVPTTSATPSVILAATAAQAYRPASVLFGRPAGAARGPPNQREDRLAVGRNDLCLHRVDRKGAELQVISQGSKGLKIFSSNLSRGLALNVSLFSATSFSKLCQSNFLLPVTPTPRNLRDCLSSFSELSGVSSTPPTIIFSSNSSSPIVGNLASNFSCAILSFLSPELLEASSCGFFSLSFFPFADVCTSKLLEVLFP